MSSVYFRTLCSASHLSRWQQRQHTSFHHATPGSWISKFGASGSTQPADYPLDVDGYVYTEDARSVFLVTAQSRGVNGTWPENELRKCSELGGVCAYDTPSEALKYGVESLSGDSEFDRYVAFEGTYVCPAPEDDGVVAKVDNELGAVMTRQEFIETYGSS